MCRQVKIKMSIIFILDGIMMQCECLQMSLPHWYYWCIDVACNTSTFQGVPALTDWKKRKTSLSSQPENGIQDIWKPQGAKLLKVVILTARWRLESCITFLTAHVTCPDFGSKIFFNFSNTKFSLQILKKREIRINSYKSGNFKYENLK